MAVCCARLLEKLDVEGVSLLKEVPRSTVCFEEDAASIEEDEDEDRIDILDSDNMGGDLLKLIEAVEPTEPVETDDTGVIEVVKGVELETPRLVKEWLVVGLDMDEPFVDFFVLDCMDEGIPDEFTEELEPDSEASAQEPLIQILMEVNSVCKAR